MRNLSSFVISLAFSVMLTSCSNEGSVQDSINAGCSHINASKNLIVETIEDKEFLKSIPYFAEAARKDSNYLVLVDKLQKSQEMGISYPTHEAYRARAWLIKFCEGVDKFE